MRLSLPVLQPLRLRPAAVQNFPPWWPVHSAFETRPTRIPRGPPPRPSYRRPRNSLPPARYFARRLLEGLAPPELAGAQPARSFRLHTRLIASRAHRQFPPRGECRVPVFSFAAVMRAATPQTSAVYELFPLREYLCWYHSRLRPLNGFAVELRVLVNGHGHSSCYRMSPSVREKCCSVLLDIVS